MARLPFGGRRVVPAVLVASCLIVAAPVAAQQPDPTVLSNPHRRQTLTVDPSTWQTSASIAPAVRARVDATITQQRALKAARLPDAQKVSTLLRVYQREASAQPAVASRMQVLRSRLPLIGVEPDGTVRARIHLRHGTAEDVTAVRALGVRIARIADDGRTMFAALSPADIDRVAASPAVARLAAVVGAQVHAGSVLSEGVAAHLVDKVQDRLKITGKGVRIGVISDGMASIAAPAATGDIPATAAGVPKVELCPLNDNLGDEGTAMLEIVHDLAPASSLAFCPAFSDAGEQGLADAVTWLATQAFGGHGADIIVDDVGYLTEPYFQDGVIAQAVDKAALHGVAYFSAAGNSADAHYEHTYLDVVPGDQFVLPFDTHDFGTIAGIGQDIGWDGIVGGGGNFFAAFLQWNDPFGGAANDYDIYIFDVNGKLAGDPTSDFPIGAPGIDPQTGTEDPLEIAFVVNQSPQNKRFFMVIDRFFADPSSLLELNFNGFFAVDPVKNIAEGSVYGHAAARGALAVAATGAVENLDGIANPNHDQIEFYSSLGPSRIFFKPNGTPGVEERRKPNITAVDGVSVTGIHFVNPFFGTSAAAPHAAAIAGLLKDVDPGLNPGGVARVLRETALERGAPGFDTTWGFGFIDAFAAAKRAGQVGNSPLFWVCLPGRRPVQLVVPEFLVPISLALGLDFGRCH